MSELTRLRQAVEHRDRAVERENALVTQAVLTAYRAKRADDTPQFTLAEIGEALGVSRQRAYQVVREAAGIRAR